ncbi:MAG: TolC family protein [Deferrisomatales bacterium]|nr:TolC family protein [Deferrisomatales bacterium]
MHRLRLAFLCALVVLGSPARGQEEARLNVDQAVALALTRNHDVLRARERLAAQGGQIQEIKSQVYPQVGLEGSYRRSYDESVRDSEFSSLIRPEVTDNYAVRTTLRQNVFSWGRVSAAVRAAEAALRQSREELAGAERVVTIQVHDAFYELLLSQRLVEVAEERLEQRERVLDVAQKRFEAGVVNELEVIRARVDVANARTPVIQARNRVRQARSRLNNLMAREQTEPLEADGSLEYVPLATLTLEEVVDRAVARRPELAALQAAREVSERNLQIARAEDKPGIDLDAEYGFASRHVDRLDTDRERWGAGLTLRFPLFDGWRTRGLVAQARSQLRDVDLAASQLREEITLEAKVALDALAEASEIIPASSLNIEQAEKALELAETSYRYGVAILLDVSDAQLALTVARTDHARSLRDYMLAKAQVLSVMGDL